MQRITLIFIFSLLLFNSCKSKKELATLDSAVNVSQLINLHNQSKPDFSTLAGRVNVNYNDGKNSQSLTVSLRIQKDQTIWVSASVLGFSVARLLITPERVSYYETINRTFFDGDFSLLSNWVGVELDFQMVQNILLGQAVFPLNDANYKATIFHNNYRLSPINNHPIFSHLFLLNPAHRIASQQIMQPQEQRVLTINYNEYQQVAPQQFPKEVVLTASENNNQTQIILDFRRIDLNPEVSFPFRIPDRYQEISF